MSGRPMPIIARNQDVAAVFLIGLILELADDAYERARLDTFVAHRVALLQLHERMQAAELLVTDGDAAGVLVARLAQVACGQAPQTEGQIRESVSSLGTRNDDAESIQLLLVPFVRQPMRHHRIVAFAALSGGLFRTEWRISAAITVRSARA